MLARMRALTECFLKDREGCMLTVRSIVDDGSTSKSFLDLWNYAAEKKFYLNGCQSCEERGRFSMLHIM